LAEAVGQGQVPYAQAQVVVVGRQPPQVHPSLEEEPFVLLPAPVLLETPSIGNALVADLELEVQ